MSSGNRASERDAAGIIASLAAEIAFVALVAAASTMKGKDPWQVVKVPATFLIGPEVVRPPGFVVGDVLLGALTHIAVAILVGLAYARLLPRLDLSPLAGGMLAAALLYGFGFWILPRLFPQWLQPFLLSRGELALQALAHLVYGLVLAVVYARLRAPRRLDTSKGGST